MAKRMITISKTIAFDSSHQLMDMPEGHPCGSLHGHTYKATIQVSCRENDLDRQGMVFDYLVLKVLKEELDHTHLNNLVPQPTAENLCRWIWDWVDRYVWQVLGAHSREAIRIDKVRVAETESTWAEITADE